MSLIQVHERALYPVIGLIGGRAMRALHPGAGAVSAQSEADATDPIAIARMLRDQGAQWLQLVDLDGARAGYPQQLDLIRAIIAETGLATQVAGGMTSPEAVAAALEMGAARVVLNGATPDEQAMVAVCAALWGEHIAVALDTRDGQITIGGWLPSDAASTLDVARAMRYLRVSTLIITSVTSQPTDILLPELRRALPSTRLIAGGSITTLDQLGGLLRGGMDGALLGRALTDGFFTLPDAVAVANDTPAVEIGPYPAEEDDEPRSASHVGDTSGSGWIDASLYITTIDEDDKDSEMSSTLQMRAILASDMPSATDPEEPDD